jgi:RNA polymerase sigma-70 factor (ECF subfamily)
MAQAQRKEMTIMSGFPRSTLEQAEMASLLSRIAERRDKQAFATLFDAYGPRLKSFMLRKGADDGQAEDLVQDTMLAVWTKANFYMAEKGSVTTWIYTIARNLRIDRLRRESSVHFTEIDGFDAADEGPVSDQILIRAQEDGRVTKALATLPREQREILLLSYVDDLAQSEIAEKLGVPLGTVKSRMRLAYQKLKTFLEEQS